MSMGQARGQMGLVRIEELSIKCFYVYFVHMCVCWGAGHGSACAVVHTCGGQLLGVSPSVLLSKALLFLLLY